MFKTSTSYNISTVDAYAVSKHDYFRVFSLGLTVLEMIHVKMFNKKIEKLASM